MAIARESHKLISFNKISEFWNSMKPKSNIQDDVAASWVKKVEYLDEVSQQNNVVIFLWNTFTNRFLYMSDKVKILSGMDPALYTSPNGVEYSFNRLAPHQVDAALLFTQEGLNYMQTHSHTDVKSILMSMSFLYRNALEEYIQVIQRSSVLEVDEQGRPALVISFVHYMGHVKKPDAIDYVISSPEGIALYNYNYEKKCMEAPETFSKQEKKIIQLLGQGLDTKQIAAQLFISPHTVITHRRNLIKKTNCIDTTGVVAFARLINLI